MYYYPEVYKFNNIEKYNELEVVNTGTGFGYYDFIYDELPVKAFNFSLTQQTLLYDYMILKRYAYKMKKGCKVILTMPYCIFLTYKLKEAEEKKERYYSVLAPEDISNDCKITYEDYLNGLCRDNDEKLEIMTALDDETMELQSINAIETWIKQLSIISFQSGELSEVACSEINKTKKVFREIIEFCKSENFEPIIVIPPMSRVLLDKISDEFRKTHFYEPLEQVVKNEYMILDYTKDVYYTNPHFYGWPGFLIKSTAKEFTRDVLEKIGLL